MNLWINRILDGIYEFLNKYISANNVQIHIPIGPGGPGGPRSPGSPLIKWMTKIR